MATPTTVSNQAGIIQLVIGDVRVVGTDGVARLAQVGDRVLINESLATGGDGLIQVRLMDGRLLDLGRNSEIPLTVETLAPEGGAAVAAGGGPDIAAVQAAIAAGADPTKVAEATAAGAPAAGGAESGGGHTYVVLEQADSRGEVTSGFPTRPASIAFPGLQPAEVVRLEEVNAPPIARADTHWAQEDITGATGNVLRDLTHAGAPSGMFADVADIDTGALTVIAVNGVAASVGTAIAGVYGTLVLNADGSYTYAVNDADPAVQALAAGKTVQEAFTYSITDGVNEPATAGLTITVFGTNDVPVARADTNWALEDVTGASGNVLENLVHAGAPGGLFADVADTDIDRDALSVATVGTFVGQHGTLALNADGSYTYTANDADPAVQALGAGKTLTDTFNYVASDGTATAAATLTITVFGTNDVPVARADTNWAQEDVVGASGNVLENLIHAGAPGGLFADVADTDIDRDALSVTTAGTFVGQHGTLVLNADGSYTYNVNNLDPTVQTLGAGKTLTDTFNYTASDGTDTAGATLTITIFGTNDVPVARPDTNWAQEDVVGASGNVLENLVHAGAPGGLFADVADTDIDRDALSVTTAGTLNGNYGTLVLNADGSYTYTVNNADPAVQALGAGKTLTDTFNYTASDGTDTAGATLTITIFGTNDVPVARPDTNWAQEDVVGASGNVLENLIHAGAPGGLFADVADTDIDRDTLSVTTTGTLTGSYGTLVLNEDGSYTYTLNDADPAVQALAAGKTLVDAFGYTASDGTDTADATLTITIFGTNDVPVARPDTNWAQEDVIGAGGNVLEDLIHAGAPRGLFADVADTDIDREALSVTTSGTFTGQHGTLLLNADGSYTYNVNNADPAVQALSARDTLTDTFNYTASDGTDTAGATLTITIFGTNDVPVARSDTNWAQEDVAGASGNVLQDLAHPGAPGGLFADVADTDIDREALTVTNSGTFTGQHGELTLNTDGSYTYRVDNADPEVQALAAGQTLTDPFSYTATDGTASVGATLTITIFGTNDMPVARGDTNWVLEDGAAVGGNVLQDVTHPGAPGGLFADVADTDIDREALTVTNSGTLTGQHGTLTLNTDGSYSYALNNADPEVQALAAGQTLSDAFNYTATDGTATAGATLTITIFGTNDAPVIGSGTARVSEEGLPLIGLPDTTGEMDLTNAMSTSGTITVSDPDHEAVSVTLGAPTTALYSHGVRLEWTGMGTDTLTAKAGVNTVATVEIDHDGQYTVTLQGPIDHPVPNVEDEASFTVPVHASDGTAVSTGTLTVTVEDDGPHVGITNALPPTLAVDETRLDTDIASADFSPMFAAQFGADGAGGIRYALQVVDGDGSASGVVDTATRQPVVLVTNGDVVEGHVGSATGALAFTITLNPDTGQVTLDQVRSMVHPTATAPDTSEAVSLEADVLQLVATATDADGDKHSTGIDLGSAISFLDDGPSVIVPAAASILNAADATFTGALDFDASVADNVGADKPGTVTFDPTQDGQDSGMTSGGPENHIYFYVSDDGKTLTGSTSVTEAGVTDENSVFTVAINPAAGTGTGNDTYTVTMLGAVDNGASIGFEDLSGTGPAGNPPWKVVESGIEGRDILFTPAGTATSVNSDSSDVGVDSQFIDFNKGLRIDFADLSVTGKAPHIDYAFGPEGHYAVNHFSFTIDQIAGGSVADITLKAFDADEDHPIGSNLADDIQQAITQVQVYDSADHLVATATGDGTVGGLDFDFNSDGDGGVTVQGLAAGYNVVTTTADGYDRVEIMNAGTGGDDGKFSLTDLDVYTIHTGEPVSSSFDVTLADADGDTASALINVTFEPQALEGAGGLGGESTLHGLHEAGVVSDTGGTDILVAGATEVTSDESHHGIGAAPGAIPSIGNGEPVDLNAMLDGVVPKATTAADLQGYVTLDTTSDPGHTVVMVDPNGAGNYQPFVKLVDVTNATLDDLLNPQHALA